PYFHFARQRSGMHPQQVHDDLADVFGLNLPGVLFAGGVVVEIGSDRSRHDGRHLDTLSPEVEHHGLCESYKSEFTRVVRGSIFEKVDAGQARDGDDVSLRFLDGVERRLDAIEYTREVGVYGFVPLLFRHRVDQSEVTVGSFCIHDCERASLRYSVSSRLGYCLGLTDVLCKAEYVAFFRELLLLCSDKLVGTCRYGHFKALLPSRVSNSVSNPLAAI